MNRFPDIRAIVFDVFGTVVDWRSSLISSFSAYGVQHGLAADWATLVDDWRGAYTTSMDRVRTGLAPWTNLDELHRRSLDELLIARDLTAVGESDRAMMVDFWHRLDPWPDTVAGLTRLRERFTIGTLSNGNVLLLTDMAKHAGLPWDCVLSAELVQHYKPDPQTYALAIRCLGPRPQNVLMAAAHNEDLLHAKAAGMPTAFIARPAEYGPRQGDRDLRAADHVDLAVDSIEALADALCGAGRA